MSILGLARGYRGIRRFRKIVTVFTQFGFGRVLHRLKLGIHVPLLRRFTNRQIDEEQLKRQAGPEGAAAKLRQAFEKLGPTFVKLGQVLSGRPDLIPEPFLSEFKALQDHVAPFPADQARKCIEKEMGLPVEQLFAEFSETPVASGSIAQVHTAVTLDGRKVVVKVKRPGIDDLIRSDLLVLEKFAELFERHVPESSAFQPKVIVEEFGLNVERELDFITEASTTEQFCEMARRCPGVRVPAVHWDLTTSGMLTLERFDGCNIEADSRIQNRQVDRKKLARQLAECFLRQYFIDGVFHADPHPGNLMLCRDGQVGLIDFGMVGRLTPKVRKALGELLSAIYNRDIETIVLISTDLGSTSVETDDSQLTTDMMVALDKYFGMPLKHIDHRQLFLEITNVANRNRLRLPRDLVMLGKSFVTLMSTVEWLDPDCDISKVAGPFARRAFFNQWNPKEAFTSGYDTFMQLTQLMRETPRGMRKLLKQATRGELQLQFKHSGLEKFALDIDRSSNRLSISIITGATIVGSSLVLAGASPGFRWLGYIGFATATVFGLFLIYGIFNSGKL